MFILLTALGVMIPMLLLLLYFKIRFKNTEK